LRFNGVSTWVEVIVRPKGLDITQAGMIGGLLLIGGIVGVFVLPPISDRMHKRKPIFMIGLVAWTGRRNTLYDWTCNIIELYGSDDHHLHPGTLYDGYRACVCPICDREMLSSSRGYFSGIADSCRAVVSDRHICDGLVK